MELNKEQVEKAMDWLDSLVGNSNDSDMAMMSYQLLGILYDTCEELTEENERLSQSLANSKSILANSKADTVRKMQERLKAEKFTHRNFGELVYVDDIDRIAEEILNDE